MFSYFEKGIKDTTPLKIIDLPELVNIIRSNSRSGQIETIRELKKRGDNYYKKLKEALPNITPNCLVNERNLKDESFDVNLIGLSGYLYFDIDNVPNLQEYKEALIAKLRGHASLICISTGGDGITILFRVTNTITKDNFDTVRSYLINSFLKDEKIDNNAGGIGRAMFISHDREVWVNYDNRVTVDSLENKMLEIHPNSFPSYNRVLYRLSDNNNLKNTGTTTNSLTRYKNYNINEILSKLVTKTCVPVLNPVVDFKAVDCVEVYIPKIIADGRKHSTYFKLIHQLYYLNPEIEPDYIYSYLFFINNTRAKPRMETRELVRSFTSVINTIKSTGQVFPEQETKRVHFNPSAGIPAKQKQAIAAHLNGAYTRSITINKIISAKQELERQGKRITNRAVARLIEMDEKTVGKYINAAPIDMVYEVSLWN